MGEESEFETRIHLLKDYQVNRKMLNLTGKVDTIFYIVYQLFMIHKQNMDRIFLKIWLN